MRTIEFDYISDVHLDSWVDPRSDKQSAAIRRFVATRLTKECLPDRPDTLIIAGDVSHCNRQLALFVEVLLDNHYKHVVLVPGNHDMASIPGLGSFRDYQARLDDIKSRLSCISGAHHLHGETVVLGGVRYGGISGWCDYSYSIKNLGSNLVRGGLLYLRHWDAINVRLPGGAPHNDPLTIFREQESDIHRLAFESDVMVTHFGPSAEGIPERYAGSAISGFFYFDGSRILGSRGAPYAWVYGHTHTGARYRSNQTDMLCNPLGRNGEGTDLTGILTYKGRHEL